MVMEKPRQIGVLTSMGASLRSVLAIFVREGAVIGGAGTLLGCGVGYLCCRLIEKYDFIPPPADIYFIDSLPIRVELLDVLQVACAAIVISLLATLYPAWKASRLEPVHAIRYE